MSLEVLDPGLASRVVDQGRPGSRHLGVPVGGAADRTALALGNALVANPPDAAGLELCPAGPRLRATLQVACVVYGAPFTLKSPRQNLATCKTFTLDAGEELHIGGTPQGMRAYLCVRGGFDVPRILDSRSALEPLKRGDVLACVSGKIAARFTRRVVPHFAERPTLRVQPGLQASWFRDEEFYQQEYTVSHASNRMGIRLQGVPLTMPDRELVSEPVAPGAVQVTRDGQCIVLGVDGQTIGGYPKIAHVIHADLDQLAQLRPGQRVRFVAVTAGEAIRWYREQRALLERWVKRLRAAMG
jgi:5-oxoprolinase (ATP-hydrolysing) subunit C